MNSATIRSPTLLGLALAATLAGCQPPADPATALASRVQAREIAGPDTGKHWRAELRGQPGHTLMDHQVALMMERHETCDGGTFSLTGQDEHIRDAENLDAPAVPDTLHWSEYVCRK